MFGAGHGAIFAFPFQAKLFRGIAELYRIAAFKMYIIVESDNREKEYQRDNSRHSAESCRDIFPAECRREKVER